MRILFLLCWLALPGMILAAEGPYDLQKAPQACSLLSKAELQKIAGEAIEEPQQRPQPQNDKVKVTTCTYAGTEGIKSMSLLVRISNADDNSPDYVKQTMKDSGMNIEDVSGVGDSAFWTSMQLQVFKGKGIQLAISVFGFSNPKDLAIATAKKTLENLSAAGL